MYVLLLCSVYNISVVCLYGCTSGVYVHETHVIMRCMIFIIVITDCYYYYYYYFDRLIE